MDLISTVRRERERERERERLRTNSLVSGFKLQFNIEFHFFYKKKLQRTQYYRHQVLLYTELNISSIEFRVAFFIEKSHITACHRGKKCMEFNISNIKFYVELNFHNIEFQKVGILLLSLQTVVFG